MPTAAYEIVWGGVDPVGAYFENVFHYQVIEISSDPFDIATELMTNFITNVETDFRLCLAQDVTLNLMHSKRVSPPGGPTVFTPYSGVGTNPNDAISNVFAADLAFYPGGALNRPGHIYMAGVGANFIDAGVWGAPAITAYTNFATTLLIDIGPGITFSSATYGTYTRKTHTVTPADHFVLKPKPTGMNKRTLPLT